MKVVNVCGFGLTGCTSQADFLSEYAGVRGVLGHDLRNKAVCRAPYQEFGILKCRYSLGGIVLAKITGKKIEFDKSVLHASLLGKLPHGAAELWDNFEKAHLCNRAVLQKEYGDSYIDVVEKTMACLPEIEKIDTLPKALTYVAEAFAVWLESMFALIQHKYYQPSERVDVIGIKNDPNGGNPLLSCLIKNGKTSAIMRNPKDAVFDYMRYYKLPKTCKEAEKQAERYNQTLLCAENQIKQFRKQIGDCWFAHEFESFVTSDSHRKRYLECMVGRRDRLRDYFQPSVSARNIGIYKQQDSAITDTVAQVCEKRYSDFKAFLHSEGLLL